MDTGPAVTQRHRRSVKRVIGKVRRLPMRRPLPLRPLSGESTSAAKSARAIQSRMLPRSVSRGLRSVAARQSGSVNDLLIRELLLQIPDWNQRAGECPDDSWLALRCNPGPVVVNPLWLSRNNAGQLAEIPHQTAPDAVGC